jgi:hypothetical protein
LKNALDGYFMQINATYGTTIDYSGLTINPAVNFPAWEDNMLAKIKELCAIYRIRFWASGTTFYFADISENLIDISAYDVTQSSNVTIQGSSIAVNNNNSAFSIKTFAGAAAIPIPNITTKIDQIYTFAGDKTEYIDIDVPGYSILGLYTDYIHNDLWTSDDMNSYLYDPADFYKVGGLAESIIVITDANGNDIGSYAGNGKISIELSTSGEAFYGAAANGHSSFNRKVPPGKVRITFTLPSDLSFKEFQLAFPGPYSLAYNDYLTGNLEPGIIIAGFGIQVDSYDINVATGYKAGDETPIPIDSPFIWNNETLINAMYFGSAFYGKPDTSISFTAPLADIGFANLDNVQFIYNNCKYRLTSANVSYDQVNITAEPYTSIADINNYNGWVSGGTKTIANLDSIISGLSLNDWSMIPLVNA